MSGTKAGGLKASATNLERYGVDFYKVIGKKGGEKGNTGGFAAHVVCECDLIDGPHKIARCAGTKGGSISRRVTSSSVTNTTSKNLQDSTRRR